MYLKFHQINNSFRLEGWQGKFLKIIRIEMENYSHHHDNGNVMNQTSMGINLFNANLQDDI
jgi:hypothetical protein